MADYFVTKRIYRVDFGETLSLGNYQSIKPALSDSVEYNPKELPDGLTVSQFKANFKEEVRQEYFKLKEQLLQDFIAFAQQVQKINIPAGR